MRSTLMRSHYPAFGRRLPSAGARRSPRRRRRALLLALADESERAAETRGVAGGEEVLGRGGTGFPRAAHFLRHREIGTHHAVARFGVPVAPAGGCRGRREKRLDLVHAVS